MRILIAEDDQVPTMPTPSITRCWASKAST